MAVQPFGEELFRKEAWLRDARRGRRWFASGNANHAQDGDFRQGRARNEDAVGCGVEIRRSDLYAVVEQGEQVVGNDAFDGVTIAEAQAHPKAVELGPAEESFALGLKVVGEFPHKVDRADFGEWDLLVLTVGRQQIDRVSLSQAGGTEIAAQRGAIQKRNDNFLVGRGWGAMFQKDRTWSVKFAKRRNVCYVKRVSLSSCCFYWG